MLGFYSTDCSATTPGAQPRWAKRMRACGVVSAAMLVLASGLVLADEPSVVDTDGDGLIEIHTLEDLHSIRYNLDGTSLKRWAEDPGNSSGCPGDVCAGYELMADLDFDGPDDDTTTWTRNDDGGYTLDEDDHNGDWFDVGAGGWLPIGDCGPDGYCLSDGRDGDNKADNRPFTAVFEGNGHTIANLAAVSRGLHVIGLFGVVGAGARIRNIHLAGLLVSNSEPSSKIVLAGGLAGFQYGGLITDCSAEGEVARPEGRGYVGGLVGFQLSGSISACHARGIARGSLNIGGLVGIQSSGSIARSSSASDIFVANAAYMATAGGLVGYQRAGTISECHATGDIAGKGGYRRRLGGLVGYAQGFIIASHATGDVRGGGGLDDKVGGLAGALRFGSITASYATGDVYGNGRRISVAGGLVGYQHDGSIAASYAKGNTYGGGERGAFAGGLVGLQGSGSITASYATGRTQGGGGLIDSIGGLVGVWREGAITASFATGDTLGNKGFTGGLIGSTFDNKKIAPILASWGFGLREGVESISGLDGSGDRPEWVDATSSLTFNTGYTGTDAPLVWNSDGDGTHGAWDFGTPEQIPALVYADYDGKRDRFHCAADADSAPRGAILIPHCTIPVTLLPGQRGEQ